MYKLFVLGMTDSILTTKQERLLINCSVIVAQNGLLS